MSFHTYFGTKHQWYIPGSEPALWYVAVPSRKMYCLKCGINKADFELKMAMKREMDRTAREKRWVKKERRYQKRWVQRPPAA